MSRGFTLIELVITLAIMALLLFSAAPNFAPLTINSQMIAFTDQLSAFLGHARSEAIWRNQDLWAHFSFSSSPTPAENWVVTLTDSVEADSGEVISVWHGSSFGNLMVTWTYSGNKIKFDGLRGRIKSGSVVVYPHQQRERSLRLKSSFAGNRIMICAQQEGDYGYPIC